MKNIVVIGATSAIAESVSKIYAQQTVKFYLLARNQKRLSTLAQDLKLRGAESVYYEKFDVTQLKKHKQIVDNVFETLGTIDIILIAHGLLPNQKKCEVDFNTTLKAINVNAISTVSLLTYITNKLEEQNNGTIAVITSIAADKGHRSSYIYSASKSMLSVFLQGLRGRLNESNVHVLDIKPGFVDTPIVSDLKKNLLWVMPDTIAAGIVKSISKRKNLVYLPWFWRYIMLIVRNLPERLFHRLNL